MEKTYKNLWQSLGFLRQALLLLALVNMMLPLVSLQAGIAGADEQGLWNVLVLMVAPVMAPLFTVVLLIDYVMSRIRAADTDGEQRALFIRIGRIELVVMAITLIFWVPFFIKLVG